MRFGRFGHRGGAPAPVAAAVALFLLAPCSGGTSHSGSGAGNAKAGTLLTAVGVKEPPTARVSSTAQLQGGGAAAQPSSAQGVFDFGANQGEFVEAIPGIGSIRIVAVGDSLYVQQPVQVAGGQHPWLKTSRSAAPQAGPGHVGFVDPGRVSDLLRLPAHGVRKIGIEPLAGASATHYHATLDASGSRRRVLGGIAVRSLPVDVWVDGTGLLRQFSYSLDASKLESGGGAPATGTVVYTLSLDDVGVEVVVSPPGPE